MFSGSMESSSEVDSQREFNLYKDRLWARTRMRPCPALPASICVEPLGSATAKRLAVARRIGRSCFPGNPTDSKRTSKSIVYQLIPEISMGLFAKAEFWFAVDPGFCPPPKSAKI